MTFILKPGQLLLSDFRTLLDEETLIELHPDCYAAIHASHNLINELVKEERVIYGITTGFGLLANQHIQLKDLLKLQRNLVLSHAAGTGELLSDQAVRLILALKINSLARGFSGVSIKTIDALIQLFNAKIYPCIPAKGSVGASGDLAPLAHLSALLLGVGEARHEGQVISAEAALKLIRMQPLELGPKEGLALLNGTQVSCSLSILGLLAAEEIFSAAIVAGCLSLDAVKGSDQPFDERIHLIRGHRTQTYVAKLIRRLLEGSGIRASHLDCNKIQDPYSLRCQPQVMGACLASLVTSSETLLIEANAVSDNPLVFSNDKQVLSGGNFHAEPVAFAAEHIAVALAEIGGLSERRIALLIDPHFSQLPAFLVKDAGINSGFMMPQVTAAALVSENKALSFPVSVDSIPTSANQEDHVSMATYASYRLLTMADNASTIVAIELLAACQGIDFRKPLQTSSALNKIHSLVRDHVSFYDDDRYFAHDIAIARNLVTQGAIRHLSNIHLFSGNLDLK